MLRLLAVLAVLAAPATAQDTDGPLIRLTEAVFAATRAWPEDMRAMRRALPHWPIAPGRAETLPGPRAAPADPWLGAVRLTAFPGQGAVKLTCHRIGRDTLPWFGAANGDTAFNRLAREAAHLPSAYVALQRCTGDLTLPDSPALRAELAGQFTRLAEDFAAVSYDPHLDPPRPDSPVFTGQITGYGPACPRGACITALRLDIHSEGGAIRLSFTADGAREP